MGKGTSACNISYSEHAYDGKLPEITGWPRHPLAPTSKRLLPHVDTAASAAMSAAVSAADATGSALVPSEELPPSEAAWYARKSAVVGTAAASTAAASDSARRTLPTPDATNEAMPDATSTISAMPPSRRPDAASQCTTMARAHKVVPGVSWGTLQTASRPRWAELGCDALFMAESRPIAAHTARTARTSSASSVAIPKKLKSAIADGAAADAIAKKHFKTAAAATLAAATTRAAFAASPKKLKSGASDRVAAATSRTTLATPPTRMTPPRGTGAPAMSAGSAYVTRIYAGRALPREPAERAEAMLRQLDPYVEAARRYAPAWALHWLPTSAISTRWAAEERAGQRDALSTLRKCAGLPAARMAQRENATQWLPICELSPPTCSLCVVSKPKFDLALVSSARMRQRLPTRQIIIALWLIAAASAIVSQLVARRAKVVASNGGNPASATRSPPPRATGIRLLDGLVAFWSRVDVPCPVGFLKLAVLLLVSVDLLALTTPEVNILSAPEVVNASREHPPAHMYMPAVTQMVMPSLSDATATEWAEHLHHVRTALLVAWGVYIALPAPSRYTAPPARRIAVAIMATVSFGVGAACYSLLGAIGLSFGKGHSTQTSLLFIAGAAFAVPDLGTNPRSGAWLRSYALSAVLASSFLAAGLAKLRYGGIDALLSGEWLVRDTSYRVFAGGSIYTRSVLPTANALLIRIPGGLMLLSWATMILEVALPLALLLTNGTPAASAPGNLVPVLARALMIAAAASFHVLTFFLMGPNFVRQLALVIAAADPLGTLASCTATCCRPLEGTPLQPLPSLRPLRPLEGTPSSHRTAAGQASAPPPLANPDGGHVGGRAEVGHGEDDAAAEQDDTRVLDVLRGIVALAVLVGWFAEQLRHDLLHLLGLVAPLADPDRFWPISSMSMFATPTKDKLTFGWTAALATSVLIVILRSALTEPTQPAPRSRVGPRPMMPPPRAYLYGARLDAIRVLATAAIALCCVVDAVLHAASTLVACIPTPSQKRRTRPSVLIVGGSFSGLYAQRELSDAFDVTLVDRKAYYEYVPGLLRLLVDPAKHREISFGLRACAAGRFVRGELIRVDASSVGIRCPDGDGDGPDDERHNDHTEQEPSGERSLVFDYLILGCGSRHACPPIMPSASEGTRPARQRVWDDAAEELAAARTVLIVGGGPVGVELAAEIACAHPDIGITLVTSAAVLCPDLPPRAGMLVRDWLLAHNVELLVGEKVEGLHARGCVLRSGRAIEADITYPCVGGTPDTAALRGGVLDASLDEKGHVTVNETLQPMILPSVDHMNGARGAPLANDETHVANAAAATTSVLATLASGAPRQGAVGHDHEVDQVIEGLGQSGLATEGHGLDPSRERVRAPHARTLARMFAIGDMARVVRSVPLADMALAGDAEGTGTIISTPTLARLSRTDEHSGLAHVAEMHAQVAVANVRRHSRGEPLLSYPDAAVGAANAPRVYCISLGEADGVLVFNGLVLSGMAAALAKRLIEWTKVAACAGRPVGALVWGTADKAAAWVSRHVLPPPTRKPRLAAPPGRAIVLFDAECMLCNGFVHWVIDHDVAGAVQFAPLQGELGREYIAHAKLEADLSTVVVIDADGVHVRSAAALRVLRLCGPGWVRVGAAVAMWAPRPAADLGYRAVAAVRYKVFGRDDGSTCRRMTQSLKERFAPPRASSLIV